MPPDSPPSPMRWSGRPPTEEVFADAGRRAAQACEPATDMRGSAEYKRHLAGELTFRTLHAAAERVAGALSHQRTRRGITMQVTMTVNGEPVTADVEPRMLLVHFLRDSCG